MKNLITIAILFFSINVFGQQFNGVNISGDLPTAISKFKAKGYIVKKVIENGVILKGEVAQNPIELFIFTTPKSKKVYKMVAYLNEQVSWQSIKSQYIKFCEIMTEKYGSTEDVYESFTKPYYEGDGYELQALGMEKCKYATYWLNKNNTNIVVEISKYKQVKLVYENNELTNAREIEMSAIENTIF